MSRVSTYEKCRLWFCNGVHYGRGLCDRHYQSFMRSRLKDGLTSGQSPRSRDLFVILNAVKDFRAVVAELTANSLVLGPIIKDENTGLVYSKCLLCGATILVGGYEGVVQHTEDCPVARGRELLERTAIGPEEVLGD